MYCTNKSLRAENFWGKILNMLRYPIACQEHGNFWREAVAVVFKQVVIVTSEKEQQQQQITSTVVLDRNNTY